MATLILKWPMTEGSGTTLNESINGREMYFVSGGSYPAWTTGPTGSAGTAITISGSTSSGAYAGTDERITCNPNDSGGISIATRFKMGGAGGGGLIGGHVIAAGDEPTSGTAFDTSLASSLAAGAWIDTDNKLRIGAAGASGVSARHQSGQVDAVVNDGAWHTVVAVIKTIASMTAYLDGAWYTPSIVTRVCSTLNLGTSWIGTSSSYQNFWSIGRVRGYFSEAQYFCKYNERSFYGDIGETRVYCGELTDSEVEQVYNEMTLPKIANALMFSCNT